MPPTLKRITCMHCNVYGVDLEVILRSSLKFFSNKYFNRKFPILKYLFHTLLKYDFVFFISFHLIVKKDKNKNKKIKKLI